MNDSENKIENNLEAFQSFIDILREQEDSFNPRYSDFLKYLETKARTWNAPLFGQFELTPLCNLNCIMCYVHLSKERMGESSVLSVAQWKEIFRQAYDAGLLEATLTGGECLTYPGFDELYLFLHSLGIQVTVMTNGILLDEKRIEFFKEHPPVLIQITLYGNNEDVYERVTGRRVFSKVVQNITRAREAGFPVKLSITPTRTLGEDVFDTIRMAQSLSEDVFVNTSLFTPEGEEWRNAGREEPDFDYYIRIRKFMKESKGKKLHTIPVEQLPSPGSNCTECDECGVYCGGGLSGYTVDWRGNMRICNRLNTKESILSLGFQESFRNINQVARSWPRIPECNGCPYEMVCDRCVAHFLNYSEPGKRPETCCENTRHLVSWGILPVSKCNI